MQYLLTPEEYNKLIPKEEWVKAYEKIEVLNVKIIELTKYKCRAEQSNKFNIYYCDQCPIGRSGTDTCCKHQQYSKY